MNDPRVEKQKPVPPFVQFCCAAIPQVFDDSLSYYEALCAMWKYLDETVKVINNNALITEDFIAKVNELKEYVDNYFDNLDVQEEINNKLDDMVEQGTLQEIITQYIQANVAWSFDTVADMKLAENFINGSFAQTLGYHSLNDGGSAIYKIRTITNEDVVDDMFIVSLADETLIAELITINGINVKQLGAYGDDTHDDTNVIANAIAHGTYKKVYIPSGTYIVTDSFDIPTFCTLAGDGMNTIIKYDGVSTSNYILYVPITSKRCLIRDMRIDGQLKSNGIYDGKDRDGDAATTLRIINVHTHLCKIGIYLNAMGSTVESCLIFGNSTNDNSGGCDTGIYVNSTDNAIISTRVVGFSNYGIYNGKDATRITNVKSFLNGVGCYFSGTEISASVLEAQENFNDNFKFYRVHGSNFSLISGGAGTVDRNDEPWPLPDTLNEYAHLNIEECDSTTITCVCNSRVAYGTRDWSCEGYIVKLLKSIGMYINVTSYIINWTKNAIPQMVSADSMLGNTFIANGHEYFNPLSKQTITLAGTYYVTLNSQSGDNYDITIKPNASGGVALLRFPYFATTHLGIFNMLNDGITISNVSFTYVANTQTYRISLQSYLVNEKTSGLSLARLACDMASILANDEQYQTFITQGVEISDQKYEITCEINTSHIASRENIKGIIEVYGD